MTFKPGPRTHLHEELAQSTELVSVQTHHGAIRGRRATNGAAVFLGKRHLIRGISPHPNS